MRAQRTEKKRDSRRTGEYGDERVRGGGKQLNKSNDSHLNPQAGRQGLSTLLTYQH